MDIKQSFCSMIDTLQAKMKELEEKEQWWKSIQDTMIEHASDKVTLDIGGQRFATTIATLTSQKESLLAALIARSPDKDGSYFIDRDPELFSIILEFLRSGKINKRKYNEEIREDLEAELKFYKIAIPEALLQFPTFPDTILVTSQYQGIIQGWTEKNKFELIYRATRDGFSGFMFHQKCDNKGPTLVVVKTTEGFLFGGYASKSWDQSEEYKNADGCFLFTLLNPNNLPPTKYECNTNKHAMFCSLNGPAFGSGCDLLISSNYCATSFPTTYIDTTGHGKLTFTGSNFFYASEIEIFKCKQ